MNQSAKITKIGQIIIIFVDMKYLIRSLKYFVYISVIMMLILAVLAATGLISTDINVIFKNGLKSLGQIELMFLGVALIYPRFGFVKRGVRIRGEYSEIRQGVVEFMEDRGYVLEKEEGENMTFRRKSLITRISRMLEDRITLERDMIGFYMEGPSKDVTRLAYGLEYKFNNEED